MVGKAGATAAFNGIYVYSSELFPTEVRSVGLSSASVAARVSGIIAPFIGGSLVWTTLPTYSWQSYFIKMKLHVRLVQTKQKIYLPVKQLIFFSFPSYKLINMFISIQAIILLSQGDIWEPLPSIIFGVTGTLGGMLIFLLPETLNKKIPETIKEMENTTRRHVH